MKESSKDRALPKTPSTNEHKNKEIAKRSRSDKCFSYIEVSMEPGIKSLKRLDSKKFKAQIKKWAKAVANYTRQASDRSGSSR
ncbi:hypothetical protein DCAR_0730279 [Daucus carota subsp. sativus]|uniref:Uncharacterized protein n=1 Tax=Daucus carota subsp. sativus TaxID=79200 RepID=A0A164USH9_DAUCS|nr:hypothetical protein DCAR_0730279 [Daucus carota subsp. sativus]